MSSDNEHWQKVYAQRDPQAVSWYEPVPEISRALIDEARLPAGAAIIDAGGGASKLAGDLLAAGYRDITVADIADEALQAAQAELGDRASRVEWIVADLRDHDFGRRYDLWHDRAVLHFMVDRTDRERYLRTLRRSLAPDGHVILATFGLRGPTQCSGLPVRRYDAEGLSQLLGPSFRIVSSRETEHTTPSGATQLFSYVHLTHHSDLENGQ